MDLPKSFIDENNGLEYTLASDYYIPNLKVSDAEAEIILGVFGMRYKNYLKNNKRITYNMLMLNGTLMQHCHAIEKQAQDMFDTLVDKMSTDDGITEKLKEEDQMEWVGRMNNVRNRAMEIVNNELIYV